MQILTLLKADEAPALLHNLPTDSGIGRFFSKMPKIIGD